jgi:Protein of unknown function (DUF3102)
MPKKKVAPKGKATTLPSTARSSWARKTKEDLLAEHADAIRRLGKLVVAEIIEIGARLTECKRICGHGNWLPWLKREFQWTEMTATRFINVYEMSKSNTVLDLDLPISGLYLLSAPSTPQSTREKIIERAKAGEKLSVKEVKQTIAEQRGATMHVAQPCTPRRKAVTFVKDEDLTAEEKTAFEALDRKYDLVEKPPPAQETSSEQMAEIRERQAQADERKPPADVAQAVTKTQQDQVRDLYGRLFTFIQMFVSEVRNWLIDRELTAEQSGMLELHLHRCADELREMAKLISLAKKDNGTVH